MSWQTAQGLRDEAVAALDAEGIDAVVTLDGSEVLPNLESGTDVLLIVPPRVERTGTALEVQTWTAYGICSQPHEVTEYWPRLDAMTTALADPLDVATFEFVSWVTGQGNEFPATQYTFTT